MSVDEVARTQIMQHMEQCEERHTELRGRLSRIEKLLIGVAGSVIMGLAGVVFKVF